VEDYTLADTYDPFNLLNNYNLQGYLEQFRVNDYSYRNAYNVDNGLFIGRGGLRPIVIKFKKVIYVSVFVTKSDKRRLTRRAILFFPKLIIIFMLLKEHLNTH
jgi:hypothetical protein